MTPAELISKHEGLRLKPYLDTVGKLSIGYGRNLNDIGISEVEADLLLDNDIRWATRAAKRIFEFEWDALNEVRQAVLIDMAFNLGEVRLMRFFKMVAAVKRGDFKAAADEMLNSSWAHQTKTRAIEDARLMRDGV